jgi:hypothetical protein
MAPLHAATTMLFTVSMYVYIRVYRCPGGSVNVENLFQEGIERFDVYDALIHSKAVFACVYIGFDVCYAFTHSKAVHVYT